MLSKYTNPMDTDLHWLVYCVLLRSYQNPSITGYIIIIVVSSTRQRVLAHPWNVPMFNRTLTSSIRVHVPASYVSLPEYMSVNKNHQQFLWGSLN